LDIQLPQPEGVLMDHDDARTILHGLALNSSDARRNAAMETVMRQREDPTKTREVTVPFPGGREVRLTVPADRFTVEDWKYLLRVFEAMRPGLLTEEEEPPDLSRVKAQLVRVSADVDSDGGPTDVQ
jgi:hypothetical protein